MSKIILSILILMVVKGGFAMASKPGITWRENVKEESYDTTKETVYLVDEKGVPQNFDSFGLGSSPVMYTGVPKGWKLIRVKR